MPSPIRELRVVTEPEREARTRLARILALVHQFAFRALDARAYAKSARERLATLNRLHGEFATANARQIVTWWGYVAAVILIGTLGAGLSAHHVHGWFFENLQRLETTRATDLHEARRRKPFTLWAGPRFALESDGITCDAADRRAWLGSRFSTRCSYRSFIACSPVPLT
ncbi:MAG: hypothetical protein HY047_04095 [Acidobacteria bacterium]|nr:hypothetical protein [Acidobacteriota bacterium]